jgi:hypothetical protein
MNYKYRKDDLIVFFNELNYNFQSNYNFILFQCQNVAEKSSRNDTATIYPADKQENGQ